MTAALDIAGLRVSLPTPAGPLHAVRNIDLRIDRNETLCLVGESGCGKSITALSALGLQPAQASISAQRLKLLGADMRCASEAQWRGLRGDRVAMIFQDPMTSLNPGWSVGEQMTEALRVHRPQVTRAQALERAADLLALCGIDQPRLRLGQYPHVLSGGMRQRVMIASALMSDPALLIADEPTTALDATVQAQILDLLDDLRQRFSLALLLITHDLGLAARHAQRLAVMYAGEIVETGPTADVFRAPRHPYTRALLDCRPRHGRPVAIPGLVPNLTRPPQTCAFAARCAHASAACEARIDLVEQAPGHEVRCVLGRDLPPATPDDVTGRTNGGAREIALELRNVSVTFRARQGLFGPWRNIQALDNVSLRVERGTTLGIVGESGSGKSTLSRILLGLQPASGDVAILGKPLGDYPRKALARLVQPVFQDPYSSLNPRRRVADIIGLPLAVHGIGEAKERKARVREMLDLCGLDQRLARAFPAELSGGQRQRVAIATALAMRPAILVCDEPTSALDVSVQAQILRLLGDIQTETGATFVFISHDLAVVRALADRVVVLRSGRLIEEGAAETILSTPRDPYTAALVAASGLTD